MSKTKNNRTPFRFTLHNEIEADVIQTLESLPRVVRGQYIALAIKSFNRELRKSGSPIKSKGRGLNEI